MTGTSFVVGAMAAAPRARRLLTGAGAAMMVSLLCSGSALAQATCLTGLNVTKDAVKSGDDTVIPAGSVVTDVKGLNSGATANGAGSFAC